ncbi:MAG: hypothetical protein C4523_00865 [Myxococcales bacterium]|nr:MAG: hypothetical protein C4523_00865 [Myxococcales bacterium]
MLDEHIQVLDVDGDHWKRLLGLFSARPRSEHSTLLLIVEDGVCLKALHTKQGPLLDFDYGSGDLAEIKARAGVDYVARVGRHFFAEAFAAAESRPCYDDDYVRQVADLYNGAIGYTAGHMEWYPHRPSVRRPFDAARAQRLFDRAVPDDRALLLLVLENGRPYTSLILGKRGGHLAWMSSFDAFGLTDAPFAPEADLPGLLEKIRERFGPVHLAFVCQRAAFENVVRAARPVTALRAAMRQGEARFVPLRLRLRLLLWAAAVLRKR